MIATEVCRFSQDTVCIGEKCTMFKQCMNFPNTCQCEKIKAIFDKDMLDSQYIKAVSETCHKCKEN